MPAFEYVHVSLGHPHVSAGADVDFNVDGFPIEGRIGLGHGQAHRYRNRQRTGGEDGEYSGFQRVLSGDVSRKNHTRHRSSKASQRYPTSCASVQRRVLIQSREASDQVCDPFGSRSGQLGMNGVLGSSRNAEPVPGPHDEVNGRSRFDLTDDGRHMGGGRCIRAV